jgi:hypothetical protein
MDHDGVTYISVELDPDDARVCDACNDTVINLRRCAPDCEEPADHTPIYGHQWLECVATCYSVDQLGEIWCATCFLRYLAKSKDLTYTVFHVGRRMLADRQGNLTELPQ